MATPVISPNTYTSTDGQDWYTRYTYINPLTGKPIYTDLKAGWDFWGSDSYNYNDWFHTENVSDITLAIGYILQNGWDDSKKENLKQYLKDAGRVAPDSEMQYIISDAKTFLIKNGVDIDELNEYYERGGTYSTDQSKLETNHGVLGYNKDTQEYTAVTPQQEAYNEYYNDLYSLKPGTLGREMLDNFTLAEQNAAISNMQLAEAQYQSAAMEQAETVKAITDSVKAERMARLRAGMSESQIANQDMQTMLNNMNTLNQNMDVLNQNRYAAQQQYNLAQDTAYQQYINSIQGLGSTSAAMYATAAVDPNYMAQQYAKNINRLYSGSQYKDVLGKGLNN